MNKPEDVAINLWTNTRQQSTNIKIIWWNRFGIISSLYVKYKAVIAGNSLAQGASKWEQKTTLKF